MIKTIKNIVIFGGGTSGWMTAAALSQFLSTDTFNITLIESDQIGTVGVGEATIPHIREFNQMLGISERDFMHAVGATYKLGIRFKGWGSENADYFHPFGTHGSDTNNIAFHHYWLKARNESDIKAFDDFSFAIIAAKKNRFARPDPSSNIISNSYSYAYHLDATAYAGLLQKYARKKGVRRIEGKVNKIDLDHTNGEIQSLILEDGDIVHGDLFIDCSGFASVLLGKKLGVYFEDWNHWLPCDSAYAIQSELTQPPPPYTISQARVAGWQWRIPLQKRMGSGHVFCSKFISDSEAQSILEKNIEGKLINASRKISFTAGMYTQCWVKNCVAIGLSAGFLEPLESTSIYLIQLGIYKLLELFPTDNQSNIERDEFNRIIKLEYERIRDFLILHYKLNNRHDSEFWQYCKNMSIPNSLDTKISLFKQSAHVLEYQTGLFEKPSWLAVFFGQGLIPGFQHPLLSSTPIKHIGQKLESTLSFIGSECEKLSTHEWALQNISCDAQLSSPPSAPFSLYGTTK